MKNQTASNNPSSSSVAKLIAEVNKLRKDVAPYTVRLTQQERQRTLKFRPGGEDVIGTVGTLAKSLGVSLTISVDDMNKDLSHAKSLKPVIQAIARLQRALMDTVLQAESEAWYAATAYYTALQRLAPQDPDIEEALKPVIAFFATGPRSGDASSTLANPRSGSSTTDEEVSDAA